MSKYVLLLLCLSCPIVPMSKKRSNPNRDMETGEKRLKKLSEKQLLDDLVKEVHSFSLQELQRHDFLSKIKTCRYAYHGSILYALHCFQQILLGKEPNELHQLSMLKKYLSFFDAESVVKFFFKLSVFKTHLSPVQKAELFNYAFSRYRTPALKDLQQLFETHIFSYKNFYSVLTEALKLSIPDKFIIFLLKTGGYDVNTGPIRGAALLHASIFGSPELITILANQGAELEVRDKKGRTPFLCSVLSNNVANAHALIRAGANPSAVVSSSKKNPFHFNNVFSENNMLILLINQNVSVNVSDDSGKTPLHIHAGSLANHHRDLTRLAFLLEHGAHINAQDDLGNTPLHMAVIARNEATLSFLKDRGADQNIKNNAGFTPLALARFLKQKEFERRSKQQKFFHFIEHVHPVMPKPICLLNKPMDLEK